MAKLLIAIAVTVVGRASIWVEGDATPEQIKEAIDQKSAQIIGPMLEPAQTHRAEFGQDGISLDWTGAAGYFEDGELAAEILPDEPVVG